MNTLYKCLSVTFISLGLLFGVSKEAKAQSADNTLHAKGRYLSILGDCAACHTANNRDEYSGGVGFKLPIGTVYATNITPDKKEGIGKMSERDFAKAVREGVGKDGRSLYPAMPYPSYARLSDEDIHDLYLYFMNDVQASAQPTPKNTIVWPLSMRWPLIFWRKIFSPNPKTALIDTLATSPDPKVQRGAYLVQGLGHCGSCHTPRGLFMQERALEGHNKPDYLKGGQNVEGWIVPSLRDDGYLGLHRWSKKDFINFLKTGRSTQAITFGGMNDVIEKSTSQWTDDDLEAVASYLKTLPSSSNQEWQYDPSTINNIRTGKTPSKGEEVYLNKCAACHASTGLGYPTAFPPLAGNPAVLDPNETSLIHIIQSGATTPPIRPAATSSLRMPAFGSVLSDQEIADVATFVRNAWGNKASTITREKVQELRKTAPAPMQPISQPDN